MRQVEAKDYRETDVEGTEAVLIGEKGRLRNFGLFLQRRGSFTRASSVGFTFIELIIIITIIGILATVAVFKGWGSTNPNALKVAIDQVITDMRFAQTMAMAKSVYVQVSFTSGSRIYRLGDEARQLPSGVVAGATRTFSFNMLGEYPETTDGYLTLSVGTGTKRIQVYAKTGYAEEN
jgi:Tfp pilus assembly protein FimT